MSVDLVNMDMSSKVTVHILERTVRNFFFTHILPRTEWYIISLPSNQNFLLAMLPSPTILFCPFPHYKLPAIMVSTNIGILHHTFMSDVCHEIYDIFSCFSYNEPFKRDVCALLAHSNSLHDRDPITSHRVRIVQ